MERRYGFEGGAASTSVTTTSPLGVGDTAFDRTVGQPMQHATAQFLNGSKGVVVSSNAAIDQSFASWRPGGTITKIYQRCFWRVTLSPGNNLPMMRVTAKNAAGADLGFVAQYGQTFDNKAFIEYQSGANTFTPTQSTGTVTFNAWHRMESETILTSASNIGCTLRLYADPASTAAPTVTLTATANVPNAVSFDYFDFGRTDFNEDYWYMDDVHISDVGWIGPYTAPTPVGPTGHGQMVGIPL